MIVYMKRPLPFTPPPSTGEGGVGVIFIFRCSLPGHEGMGRALAGQKALKKILR